MPKVRERNISFLQLSRNNRRAHVAQLLGLPPCALSADQIEIIDRVITHAANEAERTMQDDVRGLLTLAR